MVANNQITAGSEPLPLISTASFAGLCSHLTTTAKGVLLYSETDRLRQQQATILTDAEARAKLLDYCPLVEHFCFDGYVVAGGGPAWAVRTRGEAYYDYPGDIDIFPIVSPGLSSDEEKFRQVSQIYTSFLLEVRQIYDDHFASTHHFFCFRSECCTTIELMELRDSSTAMKVQFIHRVYESVAQVIVFSVLISPCWPSILASCP
jgi:hypothetical protein